MIKNSDILKLSHYQYRKQLTNWSASTLELRYNTCIYLTIILSHGGTLQVPAQHRFIIERQIQCSPPHLQEGKQSFSFYVDFPRGIKFSMSSGFWISAALWGWSENHHHQVFHVVHPGSIWLDVLFKIKP